MADPMLGQKAALIAQAAAALEGTPFRLHGRDPRFGLDCVGVVLHALHAAGLPPPPLPAYGLRNIGNPRFIDAADQAGFNTLAASLPPQTGDILVVEPGPAQLHLLVCVAPDSLIHAHAGLRRVVRMPAPGPWPIWRHLRHF